MIYKILIVFLICSTSHAQILHFKPLRKSNYKNPIVADAESHDPQPTKDNDLVTVTHECVHGASNVLRNKANASEYNAFYILDDLGYKVKEVKSFKLKDLANNIPQKHRKQIYKLYLVDSQQWWQDSPTYIVDEWNAYTCGTIAGIELKDDFRTQDSGFRMLEMAVYCQYLKRMANQDDITEFIDFLTERNLEVCKKIKMTNPKIIKNLETLKEVLNEQ